MSPLVLFDGMLLTVNGALATDLACCCQGEQGCCCLDFANVNFSFTIDCGGGNQTFTGTLDEFGAGTDVETGLWNVGVMCTPTYCTPEGVCDPANSEQVCVGFVISLFDSGSGCEANALYFCPGEASQYTGLACSNYPKADFTADLFKCVALAPVVIGSITFFP